MDRNQLALLREKFIRETQEFIEANLRQENAEGEWGSVLCPLLRVEPTTGDREINFVPQVA